MAASSLTAPVRQFTREDRATRALEAGTVKKILVADDKATGRELVRTVLEALGYEIFEASDGVEALGCARRLHPDLVILDLHMPGLDGFGVVKELRNDESFAGTPVIALTASAMQGDPQRANILPVIYNNGNEITQAPGPVALR